MRGSGLVLRTHRNAAISDSPLLCIRQQLRQSSARRPRCSQKGGPRYTTQAPKLAGQAKTSGSARNDDKEINRDFFLSVLGSTATKREAKSYLKDFSPAAETPSAPENSVPKSEATKLGVNLGSFYGFTRAVEESPKFLQYKENQSTRPKDAHRVHVALVKLRAPQVLTDQTLHGVGRTLTQLSKLGLSSVVVVDCQEYAGSDDASHDQTQRTMIHAQVDRVVAAIDGHGGPGGRRVDGAIGFQAMGTSYSTTQQNLLKIHVANRKLLMTPLNRGVIPIVSPIAYSDDAQRAIVVNGDDVVLALTREFAGLHLPLLPDDDPMVIADTMKTIRDEMSIDRLIILDTTGGIPTPERPNGYHVFLNLEQEYEHVKKDLLSGAATTVSKALKPWNSSTISDLGRGNPISAFVETEFGNPAWSDPVTTSESSSRTESRAGLHLQNLDLTKKVLNMLPPGSSALLTTPEEAANSGNQSRISSEIGGVSTRRNRNPLIHNLLTNKPVFSSSLPSSRISSTISTSSPDPSTDQIRTSPTTFIKRGMSVSVHPDPKVRPWTPPRPGEKHLSLTDPSIDLTRLVHLINDSFSRTLDVQAYLDRVNDRIAGVIIVGEYEGGALLTWETPDGVPNDGSESSRARMVPYLDKFAVLKRSQGAGGVADIVFKSMVRDCFPEGVCWRSRRDNPVNKWYFERSRGTWKMPNTNWTMFWTTPDLDSDKQTFRDYESVCRNILPSWSDKKAFVD